MKITHLFLVLGLLTVALVNGIVWAQETQILAQTEEPGTMVHQGLRRRFLLYVPEKVKNKTGVPLVIVLHGGGGTGEAIARLSGFNTRAEKQGFIVVYPEAVNRHWNDGRGVKRFRSHRDGVDDVGFIATLIDTLVKRLKVDPGRVYAAGISNGGMMCHRLGLELPDRLAAIAAVAAAMPENLVSEKKPKGVIPVLMINGTADPVVPFAGGGVGLFAKRGRVISVPKTVAFWVRNNGCNPVPVDSVIADQNGDLVKQKVYAGGRNGSEVVLITVAGGGHTWPGGSPRPARFGKNTTAVNATDLIWAFFQRHWR